MTKSLLTFTQLREANLKRIPQYKNKQGGPAHSDPEGRDWSPGDWMTAVTGEVGELAGLLKSYRRGDYTSEELHLLSEKIGNEAADIVTYLDILCSQFNIDLGDAVAAKFNVVSHRVGADVFLDREGWEPEFSIGIMSEDQAVEAGWNVKAAEKQLGPLCSEGFGAPHPTNPIPNLGEPPRPFKVGDALRSQSETQILAKWPRVEEMLRDWIFDHQTERNHMCVGCATPFIQKQVTDWAERENLMVDIHHSLSGAFAVIWWSVKPLMLSGIGDIYILIDGNVKLTK